MSARVLLNLLNDMGGGGSGGSGGRGDKMRGFAKFLIVFLQRV